MSTEVTFVQKSMTATTRRSFRVVITTRMIETVNRLVVVMHMAHIHHWAIRPRQLDVCSRASKLKGAACYIFVPCIHSGVHMPPARKRAVPACCELEARNGARAHVAGTWPLASHGQPATEGGSRRSQSSSLMAPGNISGQDMHWRVFRCADHALMRLACIDIMGPDMAGHRRVRIKEFVN